MLLLGWKPPLEVLIVLLRLLCVLRNVRDVRAIYATATFGTTRREENSLRIAETSAGVGGNGVLKIGFRTLNHPSHNFLGS